MYNVVMKLSLNKLKLKQEIDRTEILNWGIMLFVLLGYFYEAAQESSWIGSALMCVLVGLYFGLLSRLLKRLYYSFWTFLGLFAVFILFKIFGHPFWTMSFVAFFAALVLVGIQAYSLWSPIFYPIVSWWEYDFRYRDDLRVRVLYREEKSEGRLTDLRRGAGCIASFKNFKLGDELEIEPFDEVHHMAFKVEIMSKRKYSIGRPYTYGVRFQLDESGDDSLFRNFVKFYKSERKIKQRKKFKNESA